MQVNSSPRSLSRRVWHFFASIKLTLVLLIVLAITSIIGTVIPQNKAPFQYVQNYGKDLFRLFELLDLFDIYHSWWFRLLILLLATNLIVCSLNRFKATWKIVAKRDFRVSKARLEHIKDRTVFAVDSPPDTLYRLYSGIIAKHFPHYHKERTETGILILGDRGRWTRLGVYLVHLSVIILFVGALIGSLFGFSGYVTIPEGGHVDHIRLEKTGKIKPLGFTVRCDDFHVSFYPSGIPKEYRSHISIIEDGREMVRRYVVVNDPLTYRGIKFYQSSYGLISPDRAVVSIFDTRTQKRTHVEVPLNQSIDLPGGEGRFKLIRFVSDIHKMGPAFLVKRIGREGSEESFWILARFPRFDRMRGGRFMFSIENYPKKYYTGLQVNKDPGVYIVYSGFVLMLTGFIITFFMSHRQIFVQIEKEDNGSRVILGGTANKNKLAFDERIEKMVSKMKELAPQGK
nr:cytochrome c biogenesis protein ResB [Desulfobacterales bacterium]